MASNDGWIAAAGAAVGATVGLALYGILVEPRHPELTRHRIGTPAEPVTLVQLSDLHLGRLRTVHERAAAATRAALPDAILLTGDSVDDPDAVPVLGDFLDTLPDVPVLAVMGNWEHWRGVEPSRLARVLERRGGHLLVDASVRLRVRGRRLVVTGVDDLVAGTPSLERATPVEEPDAFHLLLAHCPAHRDRLPRDNPFDLVLSGHTHGGHVGAGAVAVRPPGSGPYLSGWYREGPAPMYVSRGIGTSVLPIRIDAPPEVAVFEV